VSAAIDLGAALPGQGFQPFIGRLGMMFDRLPRGWEKPWHKWPQAARRLVSVLGECARHCRLLPDGLYERFVLSDPQIIRKLEELEDKVGRRCVQKGLKQLEDLGVIRRTRQGGVRFIQFLVSFTKPKPRFQPGRKSDGARKPAPQSASGPEVRATDKPPDAPPPDPDPDPGPPLSQEEIAARIRAMTATEASPGPIPGRRTGVGPSPGASAPSLSDPERIRRAEESRKRQLEAIAARKLAREASGQDPPAVPPAPPGPDQTARE
jgi:hypothetical protein